MSEKTDKLAPAGITREEQLRALAKSWGMRAETWVHRYRRKRPTQVELALQDGEVTTLRQCEKELLSLLAAVPSSADTGWPNITRLEVIGPRGREFTQWNCSRVEPSVQDQGRTLKLFFELASSADGKESRGLTSDKLDQSQVEGSFMVTDQRQGLATEASRTSLGMTDAGERPAHEPSADVIARIVMEMREVADTHRSGTVLLPVGVCSQIQEWADALASSGALPQKEQEEVDRPKVTPPSGSTAAENETKDATVTPNHVSPLPWHIEEGTDGILRDANGKWIGKLSVSHNPKEWTTERANATFVVRCVNRSSLAPINDEGNQPPSGLRGDPVAPRTVNGEARDTSSEDSLVNPLPWVVVDGEEIYNDEGFAVVAKGYGLCGRTPADVRMTAERIVRAVNALAEAPQRTAEGCAFCGWWGKSEICGKCGRERASGIKPFPSSAPGITPPQEEK